jgi:tRNA nucleotidyltransferase (CCA-adding enzyme)
MKICLPEKVNYIISQLENAGYEAYAVGGCVRDLVLGRKPDDWDVTTSATPMQVKEIFRQTIDTGIQHGTVTVMIAHEGFEVTTYRIDGEYKDSRHPNEVIFTSNLVEDLKRRDFTINAMAYNDRSGIVDVFGGIDDLEHKIIRCVGEAQERFGEDALRMLRAVRFSAQLGFVIEDSTKAAILKLAPTIKNISAERIQTEIVKILVSENPDYMRDVYRLGISKIIMPELDLAFETPQNNPHHMYSVGEHLMHCLMNVRNDKSLRIAALLHDIGKPSTKTTDGEGIDHFHGHAEVGEQMAGKILKRLKFDNDTITKAKAYIRYHDFDINPNEKTVRRAINKIGESYFGQVLEIKKADILSQSLYMRDEKIERLSHVEKIYNDIMLKEQCVSLRTLKVTGNDLMDIGVPKGRAIGEMLNALLEDVLENPEDNSRDILIQKAINMME